LFNRKLHVTKNKNVNVSKHAERTKKIWIQNKRKRIFQRRKKSEEKL